MSTAKQIFNEAFPKLRAPVAGEAQPVAWAVYNGWSRICFYMTEDDARDHAQKAQKNHDLSGLLAAFRVVPLYAAPADAGEAQPYAYVHLGSNYATANKAAATQMPVVPVYTAPPAARLTDEQIETLAHRRAYRYRHGPDSIEFIFNRHCLLNFARALLQGANQ